MIFIYLYARLLAMRKIVTAFSVLAFFVSAAQTSWPSVAWNTGDNLTAIMDADGLNDLSGLHWNPQTNRLYCVQNDGHLRVLQMDDSAMGFTQVANKTISGGPEGITQVSFSANEFYVIDENSYEIRKYMHNATFGSLTLSRHWDLLVAPSPMEYTGNTGPEGIVFVPDAALTSAGFISQQTGNLYTSTKGMGGLLFIAHQNGGVIWAYDVNPNVNDDFAYVGKYETSRSESCDLAFDRTTGTLYILHNIDDNYLETTNLTSVVTSGNDRKFVTANEYFIAAPEDNVNIEGFALTPKCPGGNTQSAWLCRDASVADSDEVLQDVLRWFSPFTGDGDCAPLSVGNPGGGPVGIYPNPANDYIRFANISQATIDIVNNVGQKILSRQIGTDETVDVSMLATGVYFIHLSITDKATVFKLIKQ
jgi:hypothetical protein